MRPLMRLLACTLALVVTAHSTAATIVSYGFESTLPTGLISQTFTVDGGSFSSGNVASASLWSSPADGWGIYERGVSATIPFSLLDDSAGSFTPDTLGIVETGKTDPFFGSNDLANGDNASGGASAVWIVDITGFTDLSVSVDIAAMGDWESGEFFTMTASIDGGAATTVFSLAPDETDTTVYTLESGTTVPLDDPMKDSTGAVIANVFTTKTEALVGTGSILTLTLTAANDSDEAFAMDDLLVEGTAAVIPEPSSALLLAGAAGFAAWRRRRQGEQTAA